MFMCKAKYKMNLHSHAFFDYIIFLSLTETKIKDKHVASFWKEAGGVSDLIQHLHKPK